MSFDTSCRQCHALMPRAPQAPDRDRFAAAVVLTEYRCDECGHWNDLKRRKGWKEYRDGQLGQRVV
jgi:cbb3-type cytochrome oxidase cytochrome c subunit